MKVKLFIVAIICLLQSCSTTDFLDEQRVETISNDNNEVSYVIPLEDALKNVEKVLDCINGASVSRASSLKSVKNIQILSISNTISSRSSHVNADTAIYIVNYDDGFALLGADYRLDPIYAISTEGNFDLSDTIQNKGLALYINSLKSEITTKINSNESNSRASIPEVDGNINSPYQITDIALSYKRGPYGKNRLWGQSTPFNYYCPTISGTKTLVGCVAVATGLIMAHHQHPDFIDGEPLNWTAIENGQSDLALFLYRLGGSKYLDMDYGIQGEGGSANVAGTGPYIAEKVTPTQIDLVKNEDYWGGDVKVDNVIVKSFSDGSALTAALQTGDIQGTYGLQYDNYALFDGNPDYQISSVATSRCFFGQFNMKSELMQDQNVRKAIEMGIDKDGFCSVIMEGRGVPAVGAFPSSFSYGNDAVKAPSYDPEEAKKLLEESGWTDTDGDGYADKDGKKLSITWLTYPTRLEQPKLAEYAQSTLKDIGIEVDVNNTADHATYAKNGEFDVYVSSLTTAPTGDPEYFFTSTVVSDAAKNYGKYSNSDLDDIVAKLHETFDTDERGKLAVEAQQTILDDDAYFFVSHLNMGLVSKSNVSGLTAHPCDYYEITADLEVK